MTQTKRIEKLLDTGYSNDEKIIEIDRIVNELATDGIDKLSNPQKIFYHNQGLEKELNNGGFDQYFFNSSGKYAHETVFSLQAIGANITAQILQKAVDLFPNKTVPKDRDERIEAIRAIEGFATDIWEELDQEFYEYREDLNLLNLTFIEKHITAF